MSIEVCTRLNELSSRQLVLQKSLNRTQNEIVQLRDVATRVKEDLDSVNLKLEDLSLDFPEIELDEELVEELNIKDEVLPSKIPTILPKPVPKTQVLPPPTPKKITLQPPTLLRKSSSLQSLNTLHLQYNEKIQQQNTAQLIRDNPRAVEYRLLDVEARSRRRNLIFYGIHESQWESPDQCDQTLRRFLTSKLGVPEPYRIELSRVRRIGRKMDNRTRPIIVSFVNDQIKSGILNHGYMLRNTNFGITQDYPEAIRRARKQLLPDFRHFRSRGRRAMIRYPAKLIVEGKVVIDLFPGWKFEEI